MNNRRTLLLLFLAIISSFLLLVVLLQLISLQCIRFDPTQVISELLPLYFLWWLFLDLFYSLVRFLEANVLSRGSFSWSGEHRSALS